MILEAIHQGEEIGGMSVVDDQETWLFIIKNNLENDLLVA